MKANNKLFLALVVALSFLSLVFSSCEQTIHPALQSANPVLVVDAWINNKNETQVVLLTETQPYFDDADLAGVSGAVVTVEDVTAGIQYTFNENPNKKGSYEWKPSDGPFGMVGHSYKLTLQVGGETFEASSRMGRVPPIDSIVFEVDDRPGSNKKTKYRGEFYATDPVGVGDTYWIRAYKNDTLLNKPSELNVAYDAGFSAGGEADGEIFIVPIRLGINPDYSNDSSNPSEYLPGDSVYVEINSITLAAFNYLNEVSTQTDRPGGFAELFATPLANVSTNVSNINPKGSTVVGFFNVAAVSGRGKKFVTVN
jgi:hypothetical protein